MDKIFRVEIGQTSIAQLKQRLLDFMIRDWLVSSIQSDFVFSWSKVKCDSFTGSGFRGKACLLGPGFKVRMYSHG